MNKTFLLARRGTPRSPGRNYKSFLAALLLAGGLSAQAGLYTYTDTATLLPNSGNSFNVSHNNITSEPNSITSITLTLDFSSSAGLTALSPGMHGILYLGTSSSPHYETLSLGPSNLGFTSTGPGTGYFTETLNFGSSSQFHNQNPDTTWTLNLWDAGAVGNTLTSWSLDVNAVSAVPEPTTLALPIFGALAVAGGVVSRRWKAAPAAAAKTESI